MKTALASAAAAAILFGSEIKTGSDGVVVHEWGTFTSVAQEDGSAVEWLPLEGPPDLPCFVNRSGMIQKVSSSSLVRMETPVLYFYANHPATASVEVKFPQGYVTEWYPNVSTPRSAEDPRDVRWDNVQITPGADPAYPTSAGSSHYSAARMTDAAPLRIGGQQEKMIFYRGFATFRPPLQAAYEKTGKLRMVNTASEPIPFAIAFENQGGRAGYRIAENLSGAISIDPPELTQDVASLREDLARRLTALGLYPKEARAMVATWADSWFNDGARVFYIYPRSAVDSLLPLKITPAPAEIQRVFVGRLEVLSPATRETLTVAARSGDAQTLAKYARFLRPFFAQIQRADKTLALSAWMQNYIKSASGETGACVQ